MAELVKRKETVGSLGAIDFLIEFEKKRLLVGEGIAKGNGGVIKRSYSEVKNKADKKVKKGKRYDNKITVLRKKLFSLGFTDVALRELQRIAKSDSDYRVRAKAAYELALWYFNERSQESAHEALEYVQESLREATDSHIKIRLAVLKMLCLRELSEIEQAKAFYLSLDEKEREDANVKLAWANFIESPNERLKIINSILESQRLSPIFLNRKHGITLYDHLDSDGEVGHCSDGPKVTVLVAVYDAADTIITAIRSLQKQTYRNLEIIVIDDCSPNLDTFSVVKVLSEEDPRIKVIRMEKNGGAYIARNHGLDIATGKFVTLHDADDWSHPLKIEKQVRYLESNPSAMACLSQQARAREDLIFQQLSSNGLLVTVNSSSLMFRRSEVCEKLGYWDTVRCEGDTEFISRLKIVFGNDAIHNMPNSLYSFQRDSERSIVSDEFLGIGVEKYGARREYEEAKEFHYARGGRLKYTNDVTDRPFPAPRLMTIDKEKAKDVIHYDVVIASDFRLLGGSSQSNVQEILAQKANGMITGILPMFRYDFNHVDRNILPEVSNQIDGDSVSVINYGDNVECDLLIVRYPPVLYRKLRYLPQIKAKQVRVIVNQPPMSDYGPKGVVRYKIKDCATNIKHYLGKEAIWHPIGPLVRDALNKYHKDELKYINLSDRDWFNIIDLSGWKRPYWKVNQNRPLRIGRHSRDHMHKWPEKLEDLVAAYPVDVPDIEVHVLGGSKIPVSTIGYFPKNWIAHKFNSIHPKDFLSEIDIFVYFTNTSWVESFGRVIIEAMAVGVPVILPEIYRPLFQDSALYCTPEGVEALAWELYTNPVKYYEQVEKAHSYVVQNFSFESHIQRVKNLKPLVSVSELK